jgi:RND family efflux transporter MFP subunit
VNEKASLLERLRIDRGEERRTEDAGAASRWRIIATVVPVLVLGAAGVVAGLWFGRHQVAPLTKLVSGAARSASPAPEIRGGASAESASPAPGTAPPGEAEQAPRGTSVLDASGYVVAQRQATVSAKSLGRLRDLLIEAGQSVHGGDVIARLDDSNTMATLQAARAQLAQANAGLEAARVAVADQRPIFERNQRQRAAQVISAQDFDTAKSQFDAAQMSYASQQAAVAAAKANVEVAERAEEDTVVRAPFSGVVTDRAAQPGEIVSPMATGGFTRTGICTIVDMSSLEAEVDVSESFINRVHPGQPATVRLNAYPDWSIPGSVVAIIPTADRSKATVKVRVAFKIQDPRILPEMGARVSFLAENERAAHAGKG